MKVRIRCGIFAVYVEYFSCGIIRRSRQDGKLVSPLREANDKVVDPKLLGPEILRDYENFHNDLGLFGRPPHNSIHIVGVAVDDPDDLVCNVRHTIIANHPEGSVC